MVDKSPDPHPMESSPECRYQRNKYQKKNFLFVENTSKYPVVVRDESNKEVGTLEPEELKLMRVDDGTAFLGKIDSLHVLLGRYRKASSRKEYVLLENYQREIIKIGQPLQYISNYSPNKSLDVQKGIPWVDIYNYTSVPISLVFTTRNSLVQLSNEESGSDIDSNSQKKSCYFDDCLVREIVIVHPGRIRRYNGKYGYGIPYDTYVLNIDGIFSETQILTPITHLIYGVL